MTTAQRTLGSRGGGFSSPTPAREHADVPRLSTAPTEPGVTPKCIALPRLRPHTREHLRWHPLPAWGRDHPLRTLGPGKGSPQCLRVPSGWDTGLHRCAHRCRHPWPPAQCRSSQPAGRQEAHPPDHGCLDQRALVSGSDAGQGRRQPSQGPGPPAPPSRSQKPAKSKCRAPSELPAGGQGARRTQS